MCSAMRPPFFAHCASIARSEAIQAASSSSVTGNGNGAISDAPWRLLPRHRRGVLRATPRGSNPTMSNRSLTSGGNRDGPSNSTRSTPELAGPPGLTKSEPRRSLGSPVARRRTSAIEIVPPVGLS